MPTDAQVQAAAVALARSVATTPFSRWTPEAREQFRVEARAALEAAEKTGDR